MSKKIAILVANDTFSDPALPSIAFAESDARALAAALEEVGFASANRLLLLGPTATKTAIESRLRQLSRKLTPADEVLFFYCGLGFAAEERGYLACRDTLLEDLAPTSLALADLWHTLQAPRCRVTLFLDAGAGDFSQPLPDALEAGVSRAELADEFADDPSAACFLSAQPGESSHAAGALKRRVWNHHLIEAFTGAAPDALLDGLLTAGSLQDWLEREVPRTLRKVISEPVRQTPAAFGKDLHLPGRTIADLRPVLAAKQTSGSHDLQQLRRVVFRTETRGKVKDLTGYQKGHRIPDQVTPAAEKFVARIAADDVHADVEEIFNALRERMNFKRKDLEASAERDGQGFVRTPVFDYTVHVTLDPNDPTQVVWQREVSHIQDPELIRGPAFAAVFGTSFDTLIFEFAMPLDVAELVDRIEEDPIPGVRMRSSIDASSCEITLEGFAGAIRVQADRLTITGRSATAAALIDQFFEFQSRFGRKVDLPALRG
jgi:hypothetical protein